MSPAKYILLAPLTQLSTHTRFLFTLRSDLGGYHSLLLFHLSNIGGNESQSLYVMEAACPHLGADLSHAEIEECETDVVAVCPWHGYDFNLKSGVSETGLKACTYAVEIRENKDEILNEVWVETPEDGDNWELVELRPVSEEFANSPLPTLEKLTISPVEENAVQEPVVPRENKPNTLIEWAVLILNTADPDLKVQRTRHSVNLFRTGKLKSVGRSSHAPIPPDEPPRHTRLKAVDPRKVGKRGKAGSLKSRIATLHGLAHIEQWAINLSWDIIARFGRSNPDLPLQFFSDFTKVALDEAKHFSLLSSRLVALSSFYGSLPINGNLWESAATTSDCFAARLAIIHLVHEARGLDINPNTIAKFGAAGDSESVEILNIIHLDEITHVTAGHRWFTWVCEREGHQPVPRFRELIREHFGGILKGPFNEEDRRKAGLGPEFYEDLRGEAADVPEEALLIPDAAVVTTGPVQIAYTA